MSFRYLKVEIITVLVSNTKFRLMNLHLSLSHVTLSVMPNVSDS